MAANPEDRKTSRAGGTKGSAPSNGSSVPTARRSASFLVRFWQEPREDVGSNAPLRGYVRDLHTGTECYLSSLEDLAERVRAGLNLDESGTGRLNELQGGK